MWIMLRCGVRKIKHGMSKSFGTRHQKSSDFLSVFMTARQETGMAVNGPVNGFSPLLSVEQNTSKMSQTSWSLLHAPLQVAVKKAALREVLKRRTACVRIISHAAVNLKVENIGRFPRGGEALAVLCSYSGYFAYKHGATDAISR